MIRAGRRTRQFIFSFRSTQSHTIYTCPLQARLWDALVKQHRTVGQSIPTNTNRRDAALHDQQRGSDARSSFSSSFGYAFSLTTPPLLPKTFMASKNKQQQLQQDERRNKPATTDIYPNLHATSLIETDSFRQVDAAAPFSVVVEGTLPVVSNNGTGESSSVTSNPNDKVGSSSVKLECSSGKAVFSSEKRSHPSNNNPNSAVLYTAVVGLSRECVDPISVAQRVTPPTGGDRLSHSNNIDVRPHTSVAQRQNQDVPYSAISDSMSIKPGTSSGPKPIPPPTGSVGGVPFGGLATVVSGSPSGVLSSSPGSYNGPSSLLTASSFTVGVPVAVLQQMLLAVGAVENDVPMLQCWAYQRSAAAAS